MPRAALLSLLSLLACHPVTARPSALATAPARTPAAPAVTPAAPAARWVAPEPLGAAAPEIERDLDAMVGGHFTPDHLGPAAYAEILARARAHAAVYAHRIAARHASRMATEPALAQLHITTALALLEPHAPMRVAASARHFLPGFEGLAARPDIDPEARRRAGEQVAPAKVLAGGIDRPLPAAPDRVRPDRVCAVATPAGHGVMPELTCTCGDTLACAVRRDGDALALTVARLPEPGHCSDCTAAWTTCAVPRLAPGERLELRVDGEVRGAWTVNAGGWLPVGACL